MEVTINHTFVHSPLGREEVTLVRYSEEESSLRVLFERRVFEEDSEGVECDPWACPGEDEEACSADPSECSDCDQDGTPECPGIASCVSEGCKSVQIDECVPAGRHTYALFTWLNEEYINCDEDEVQAVEIQVDDVGQDCPRYRDEFECVDMPWYGDGSGCSVAPSRTTGGLSAAMLLIGLGGFLFSRIRRRR